MPPEEDSAAAISKVHKNLVKNTRVVPEIIMLTDRQTGILITILHAPTVVE